MRPAADQEWTLRATVTRRIKIRREPAHRRRNPIARALREAAFRARKEQSRRHYSRKSRHRPELETDRSE
jgi:hypothetical protein